MKHLQTFESFLNEAKLNEANLPQTIADMEKILPKVVKIEEFLTEWDRYSNPFRSSLDMESLLSIIAPNLDKKSIILSQGQYVTYEKKQYEQGYGGTTKASEAKADYDKMVNNREWDRLFTATEQASTKEKFFKKVATELQKSLGALEAAKKVLVYTWNSANGMYDRYLIMDKYYSKLGNQLWHDASEVRNAVSRGYMYAGKNLVDSPWREYLIKANKQ